MNQLNIRKGIVTVVSIITAITVGYLWGESPEFGVTVVTFFIASTWFDTEFKPS